MKDNEDFESPNSRSRDRQTTFGYNSEELHQIDQILHEFKVHPIALPTFVAMMQAHPFMRQQTKLIQELFRHPELVQDMLAFLLQPHRMLAKYKLSAEQGLQYIRSIAQFTKENLEFYQFLFIALEDNSRVVGNLDSLGSGEARKEVIDCRQICLEQWFTFLDDKTISKDERRASLGYIAQILTPFVNYEFSRSSRISDYYEERYKKEVPICLIFHFSSDLVQKLVGFSHHEAIFKLLFKLVLISLEQQEWKHSLSLLNKLCEAAVVEQPGGSTPSTPQETSDSHIQNIYSMVKEVSDNITNDRNRTVFAFIAAIIKSQIVKGAINRLKRFSQQFSPLQNWEAEWVMQLNIKTEAQIVKIYYLLLRSKINRNATLMNELRSVVILITKSLADLISLINVAKVDDINFSNGESFKATPFFKYEFFNLIRYLLLVRQDHSQLDEQLRLQHHYPHLIALIQTCLSQNRWNSISHALIEKILGMIITTEFFKTKDANLNSFLQFLMQAFTNKKYVFLNSTRMTNQGDIQSLYNICRKIAVSFEKASLSFGLSNQYEQWRGFVLSVLQGYEKSIESRTSSIESEIDFIDSHENQAFTVEIDEVATVKQIVQRIETKQIWMNKSSSSKNLFRSGSEQSLLDLPKTSKTIENFKREAEFSPTATAKPRVSLHQEKPNKTLISEFQAERKFSSSTGNIKQDNEQSKEEEYLRLSKILSIGKHTSEVVDERDEHQREVSSDTEPFIPQAEEPIQEGSELHK